MLSSLPSAVHQVGPLKHSQVFGDGRRRDREGLSQIPDSAFPVVRQALQHSSARPIRQRSKNNRNNVAIVNHAV
jgi:hypothetical protein